MSFPDFKKVAETFGFRYICCHNNGEVEKCIQEMMQSKERVLLEVLQAFDDPVTPKVM